MKSLFKYITPALLMFSLQVSATHIVGGELYYEKLTGNDYLVTLKIYRDCNSRNQAGQLTPFDQPALIVIYDQAGNLIRTEDLSHKTPSRLPVIVENPCLQAPPNICVDEAVYEKILTLPASANDYILTYQRCCRNQSIVNISGPAPFFSGTHGSTYTTTIPGTSKIANNSNSSPIYKNFPPLVICLNDNIRFDHSASDGDGDSLVYELCDPYVGFSPANPEPRFPGNIPTPPPYSTVPWSPGFSATNPITASPSFGIDRKTGILTGSPTAQGQYVVGVCVKEYRNGVLLSETKRDFQFNVTFCDANPVAAASTQSSYCDGLKVKFENQSTNAKYFYWDFGDPTSTSDTSIDPTPTYTYSDTGKYFITLIVNKGWPCADTTTTEYSVYPTLDPRYTRPLGQCFNEHSFDLEAEGLYQNYATFEWDFGKFGNPTKSYVEKPKAIRFTKPGDQTVRLIVRENGCEEIYEDTLQTYPNPKAEFELPVREDCIPFEANFKDLSSAWTAIYYLWDFGDGTTSTEPNPKHVYTKEGRYTVNLRILTDEVCVDTAYFIWERLIKANGIPTAQLDISSHNISSLQPVVHFKDESINSVRCKLDLGDGNTSYECDYSYAYRDTGRYEIMQVVFTDEGCTDTLYDVLHIRPELLFYAPNAFTPTGDGLNEIYKPSVYGAIKYRFLIMNRWGEMLFETTHVSLGWDGILPNGRQAPVDSYVYFAEVYDAFGKKHEYRGLFSLLR